MDYLTTAYKEAKRLSNNLSEEDSRLHMAKTHFFLVYTPSWLNHSLVGPVILSAWKITASRRNCSTVKCLKASTPREARKSASKTHWSSPGNLSVSPPTAWNIWRRTRTSGMKLSNVMRKSVKKEDTPQLSCAGNFEKAVPHQPLLPPFFVLTAKDYFVHRLVS